MIAAETATALFPSPPWACTGRSIRRQFVVPYSSLHSVTSPPFGLTVAFRVAVVWAIAEAGFVSTVGGFGQRLEGFVSPLLVPAELVATILKW